MSNQLNSQWKNESDFDNWELRDYRFSPEMRKVIMDYLHIKPTDDILDVGCGTGVFTRYIGKGLTTGSILGVDISPSLVRYGNHKINEVYIQDKVKLIEGDGYHLPFEDHQFDSVTSYTYLGVLNDPELGLREKIRVCKPGGYVSVVFSPGMLYKVGWSGNYPFKGTERLQELYNKQEKIYKKIWSNSKGTSWSDLETPLLLKKSGLEDISIFSFSHCFSYSDNRWSLEYRKKHIINGLSNQLRYIKERSKLKEFEKEGMPKSEFDELINLIQFKQDYLLNHLDDDQSFEWSAGMSIVVVGRKTKDL